VQGKSADMVEFIYAFFPVVVLFISILGVFDSTIRSILALPVAVIIPYQIGDFIFRKTKFQDIVEKSDVATRVILEWVSGMLVLFSLVLFLSAFPFWSSAFFYIIIILMPIILLRKSDTYNKSVAKNITLNVNKLRSYWKVLPPIIIGSISAWFTFAHQVSPLVQSPNANDVRYTLWLTDGGTFFIGAGQTPFYILMIALISKSCQSHPMFVFHIAPLLQYIAYTVGIYLLSHSLTGNMWASILASAYAVSVSVNALNNFGPKPLLVSLFPSLLYISIEEGKYYKNNDRHYIGHFILVTLLSFLVSIILLLQPYFLPIQLRNIIVLLFTGVAFVVPILIKDTDLKRIFYVIFAFSLVTSIIHVFESPLVIAMFLFCLFFSYTPFQRLMTIAICGVTLLFVIAQLTGFISFSNNFMFSRWLWGSLYDSSWFNMNALQKWQWIYNSFHPYIFYLSIMGCILSFLGSKKGKNVYALIALFAVQLFILFLPEGHLWRVRDYMEPIVSVFSALALFELFNWFTTLKIKIKVRKICIGINLNNKAVSLIFLLLGILLIPYALQPRLTFMKTQMKMNPDGYFSFDLPYEYEAAKWIYNNYPKQWVRTLWWSESFEGVEKEIISIHSPTLRGIRYIEVPLTRDTLIISDPYTMWLLEGLTGRDDAIDERVFIYENEYSLEAIHQMENVYQLFLDMIKTSFLEEERRICLKVYGNPVLHFNGQSYIRFNDFPELNPSAGITIEALVKLDTLNPMNEIVSKELGYAGYYLYVDSFGKAHFGFNGGKAEICSHTSILPGFFYHIVGTYDKNQSLLMLYINGILDTNSSTSETISYAHSDLSIGSFLLWGNESLHPLNGSIAYIRIYNVALNLTEINWNIENPYNPIGRSLVLWIDGWSIKGSNCRNKAQCDHDGIVFMVETRKLEEKSEQFLYHTLCEKINSIRRAHSKVLIVLSERTSTWLSSGGSTKFVLFPFRGIDSSYLRALNSLKCLKLVYSIKERIYIYEVQSCS